MNKVILIGRLTRDPEMRTTPSGVATTSFSIAVQRNYANAQGDREADFINCVAWRKQAENIAKYCTKGSQVAVDGRIQTRNYDAQDGTKRYTTDVVVDNFEFLGSRNDGANAPAGAGYSAPASNNSVAYSPQAPATPSAVETTDISEDPYKDFGDEFTLSSDDLPF